MRTELTVEAPLPYDQQPTFVPLFRYGPKGLEARRVEHTALSLLAREEGISGLAWEKQETETSNLEGRLHQARGDIYGQMNSLISSITVGRAFLKFLDTFTPQGLTKPEILRFFESCLYINYVATDGSVSDSDILAKRASPDFAAKKVKPVLAKMAHSIPDWFHGDFQQYQRLIVYYSVFERLLDPEYNQASNQERIRESIAMKTGMQEGKDVDITFGFVERDGIPDWLSENAKDPDTNNVQEELKTDERELELLKQEALRFSRQLIYLKQGLEDKKSKLNEWQDRRWNEVRIDSPCLGDFLSYLHLCGDVDSAIRFFVNLKDREFDPETLAIWIEDNFTLAGIIKGGKITENGHATLNTFLKAVKTLDLEQKATFHSLRETNKHGYNALNFNLGPVIEILTEEDVSLLGEFLDDQKLSEAGPFISFMGDLISERLKQQKDAPRDPKLNKAINEYREFLRKFLRRNWSHLYQDYLTIIFPGNDITMHSNPEQGVESDDQISQYPKQLVREFGREVKEIEKGHLGEWAIFYSADQTTEKASLIPIEGETLNDKAKSLHDLFLRMGVSSSIKDNSIVNALDWKTQVPKDIEQLTPGIIVKGERWKKIKRQGVRILYRMSPEDKRLIFFVYQKKGWAYDLVAA